MRKFYQIAIDGPAGSGKSTVAKLLAQKLGFIYIDSGAMYRVVTFYMIKKKLLKANNNRLTGHLKKINIIFKNINNSQHIFLGNTDVTRRIRTSKINKLVSTVSSINVVRKEMVKRQRKLAINNSVVMDGRDIGTNVLRSADLKIYLTASPYIRSQRRKKDLKNIGEIVHVEELVKQIHERDNYDSSRDISPLCKAQDAIVIDSSSLPIDKVLEKISLFLVVLV